MAAAALAHGGFGGDRDFEISAALEARDFAFLDSRLIRRGPSGFGRGLAEPEMGTAFLAIGGISPDRLALRMATLRASDCGGLWLGRRHGRDGVGKMRSGKYVQ
jgi:hypothetical protein